MFRGMGKEMGKEMGFWSLTLRYLFGGDIVSQFNRTNGIGLICRAHQLVMEGYKYMFNNALVTVWSAPNYCYRCGNVAAILELDENLGREFKVFDAAPQVYFLLICRKTAGIPKSELHPTISCKHRFSRMNDTPL